MNVTPPMAPSPISAISHHQNEVATITRISSRDSCFGQLHRSSTLTTGHIHGVQAAAPVMTAKVASAVVRGVDLKRQIREINAATCSFAPLS